MGEKPPSADALTEACRSVSTPVAQHSIFVVAIAVLGCWIASSSLGEIWKGCLLIADLALIVGIVATSLRMAICNPHDLTFDKDAHLKKIEVANARGAEVFDGVDIEEELPEVADAGR